MLFFKNCCFLLDVYNPFDNKINIRNIAKTLLKKKKESEESYLEYLDQLSGRFVIFTQTPTSTEIYHDACGTRSVFYDTSDQHVAISSHCELIADLFGYHHSKKTAAYRKNKNFKQIRYMPGLYSPFDEIKPLTPNTKYIVERHTVERIFPRKPLEPTKSLNELIIEIGDILRKQAELICSYKPVSVSLTAGMDSRLTYAVFSGVKGNIDYFTHSNLATPEAYSEDVQIAKSLTEMENKNHKVFNYSLDNEQVGIDDFKKIWLKNLGMNRGSVYLFKAYADAIQNKRVHVRSNLAEITRAYYKKTTNEITGKTLAGIYTKTELKNNPEVLNAFEDFIEVTQFKKDKFYNYEYTDLFYWEHRMSLWHSYIVLESDMAFDTFIIYNNRLLLTKMLSAPLEVRRTDELFLKLIEEYMPKALELPINKKFYNTVIKAD